MKRLVFLALSLIFVQSLMAQQVSLSGKIINYTGKDSITLQIFSQPPIFLTSEVSKKGEFSFTYTENSTNFCKLFFSVGDEVGMFLTSGEEATITAEYGKLQQTAVVKGSVQTEMMQKNIRLVQAYVDESENIKKIYTAKQDSLEQQKNEKIAKNIRSNPYMLSNLTLISILPMDGYSDVYQLLDSTLTKTYPTNAFVEDFHNNMLKLLVLREGATIADISLPDENGSFKAIEKLRGKVVLVDFWASWCRPCRMEIPNFKKLYDAYHGVGFDIYSISVDNDATAWKNALKQEQMPWTNVRDDQKTYSNMYNVSSIPFTILIDKEGKVLAKGLRGQELSDAIHKALSSD